MLGLSRPALAQSSRANPPFDGHDVFTAVGGMYDIDPDLLAAIATVESDGRDRATSPKGAVGLMQLMPATGRRFQVDNLYDPVQNLLGAARFIAFLRTRQETDFGAVDLPRLLAAYNAGENTIKHYRGIPPFAETRDYVRKVLWLYLAGLTPPRAASTPGLQARTGSDWRSRQNADLRMLARLSSIRRARAAAEKTADERER